MKRLFLSTVSALALTHGATAADMPLKAPPPAVVQTWSGFYLGLHGGFVDHWGKVNDLDNLSFGGVPSPSYSASKIGGIFGGNAGYNVQTGAFVFGVEGDWNWLGAAAGATATTVCLPPCTFTTSFDVRWLATARVRAGIAADATLFYVTGGAAFGRVVNSAVSVFPPVGPIGTFSQDTTKAGWTVGAGAERMFGRNWTARAELRYANLGKSTVTCGPPGACNGGTTYRGEFSNSLLVGLIGVDFKF
jgi:outer membrane immunogenic protein